MEQRIGLIPSTIIDSDVLDSPSPTPGGVNTEQLPYWVYSIDLIYDTRHICTRSRNDRIKAMSRGISRGKKVIKFADTSSSGRVRLFYQNETTIS